MAEDTWYSRLPEPFQVAYSGALCIATNLYACRLTCLHVGDVTDSSPADAHIGTSLWCLRECLQWRMRAGPALRQIAGALSIAAKREISRHTSAFDQMDRVRMGLPFGLTLVTTPEEIAAHWSGVCQVIVKQVLHRSGDWWQLRLQAEACRAAASWKPVRPRSTDDISEWQPSHENLEFMRKRIQERPNAKPTHLAKDLKGFGMSRQQALKTVRIRFVVRRNFGTALN